MLGHFDQTEKACPVAAAGPKGCRHGYHASTMAGGDGAATASCYVHDPLADVADPHLNGLRAEFVMAQSSSNVIRIEVVIYLAGKEACCLSA